MKLWEQVVFLILKVIRTVLDFISDLIYPLIYERQRSIKLPQIQNDLLMLPAIELAEKIRTKETSSQNVVQAFIDRVNAVNGIINALVDQRFEQALAEAKAADDEIDECEDIAKLKREKPFLGVPFTTKDCFEVCGLSHTAGLLRRGKRLQKASKDADSVALLRAAGGDFNIFPIFNLQSNPS